MTQASYAVGIRQQINKIPNWLTFGRVVLTFPVVICGALGWYYTAVVLILLAGISDGLDGWLARVMGEETPLGRVSDPLADKFFTDFVLLAAGLMLGDWMLLTLWVVALSYDIDNTWQRRREIGRAFLNLPGDAPDLPATFAAKSKTCGLFLLVAYAHLPPEVLQEQVLNVLTLVCLTAVCYSWLNNRAAWLRQHFG